MLNPDSDVLGLALADVMLELQTAMTKFPSFHSAHEGYAVMLEEVDELWELVRIKQGLRLPHLMRAEAIQIAAMALRFIHDICTEEKGNV